MDHLKHVGVGLFGHEQMMKLMTKTSQLLLSCHQDPSWLCEKECYVDMLSSPQHTAKELHILWDKKRVCGDPCGCPWDQ